MKAIVIWITGASLGAALAVAQPTHARGYVIKDLGPLQGPGFSYAPVIANSGWSTGWWSALDGPRHAALWNNGVLMQDIGAQITGADSGLNSEGFGVNDSGQVAFQAETLDNNPNGEDFCGFTVLLGSSPSCPYCSGTDTPHTCRPFRWNNGTIEQLPMLVDKNNGLNGNNAGVNQMNNRGDIAGLAETATPDPNCPSPQQFEFKPVVWRNGQVKELAIPSGDPEGFASGINDNGQVVGWSGTCASFDPIGQLYLNPVNAWLWDADGTPHHLDLPAGSTAGAINNRGQIVGSSGLTGFLWTQSAGAQPLYPLPTDLLSFTLGISDSGHAVGGSLDESFTVLSAVLWQSDSSTPVNLNDLAVDNESGLYLQLAEGINSRGEITGFASSSADLADIPHAFLAIPVNASPAAHTTTKPAMLSENARQVLQRRMRFGRFGSRLSIPR